LSTIADIYAGLAPVCATLACLGVVMLAVYGYQKSKQTSQDDDG